MTYPTEITASILEHLKLVPDETIRQDIAITEAEITSLKKEIEGNRLIAEATPGTPRGKMAAFFHDGKSSRLNKRRDFIRYLKAILEARADPARDDR